MFPFDTNEKMYMLQALLEATTSAPDTRVVASMRVLDCTTETQQPIGNASYFKN
jgi:hypothetical protein